MKKLVFTVLAGLAVLVFVAGACSRSSLSSSRGLDSSAGNGTVSKPGSAGAPGPGGESQPPADTSGKGQWGAITTAAQAPTSGTRLIVRNASLDIQVDDVTASLDGITQAAAQAGGYVVSATASDDGRTISAAISVRVPAEKFDQVLKSIRASAIRIFTDNISSQDVSQEYVDLQSQLTNLKATEQQLLKILQQAGTVTETLSVQREITTVQGNIEQTKGRIQFLEQSTATSLIEVRLRGSGLVSDFAASATNVNTGEEITFTDRPSGGTTPYSYQWSFGDGSLSDQKSPSHTYNKAGFYSVSLKVTDNKSLSATETKKSYINVTQAEGWSARSTFSDAAGMLGAIGKGLLTAAIYLLLLSPIWGGALALGLWLSHRAKKKKS